MLRKIGSKLDQAIKTVCGILLFICLAASTIDIINRFILGSSVPWAHEVSIWSCIIFTFLFTGIITLNGTHISSDLVDNYIKGYPKAVIKLCNLLATLLFCAIACYGGIRYALYLLRWNVTTDLGVWTVPLWPMHMASIGLGMLIATAYCLVAIIKAVKSFGANET